MTLPQGFSWTSGHQYEAGEPTSLGLDGVCVARLLQKIDGSWFVRLECQQPIEAPLVTRDCTSFEQGRAGAEEWARRNEARLRVEVADRLSKRRRDKV